MHAETLAQDLQPWAIETDGHANVLMTIADGGVSGILGDNDLRVFEQEWSG